MLTRWPPDLLWEVPSLACGRSPGTPRIVLARDF